MQQRHESEQGDRRLLESEGREIGERRAGERPSAAAAKPGQVAEQRSEGERRGRRVVEGCRDPGDRLAMRRMQREESCHGQRRSPIETQPAREEPRQARCQPVVHQRERVPGDGRQAKDLVVEEVVSQEERPVIARSLVAGASAGENISPTEQIREPGPGAQPAVGDHLLVVVPNELVLEHRQVSQQDERHQHRARRRGGEPRAGARAGERRPAPRGRQAPGFPRRLIRRRSRSPGRSLPQDSRSRPSSAGKLSWRPLGQRTRSSPPAEVPRSPKSRRGSLADR